MYRVLLPVDADEERARRAAEAVLELPGDHDDLEVVILNVFEQFEVVDESRVDSADIYDETDFPDSVDVVAEILADEGISVVKCREHGNPVEQINSVANELSADIIVTSGRKRSPAGKVLFGSVTQSLLLSAECPIIVTMEE